MTTSTSTRRHLLTLVAALAFTGACNSAPPTKVGSNMPGAQSTTSDPSTPRGTPIRIRIADTVVAGELWDNAPARALIEGLPVTLNFSDLNNVEKTARFDPPLPMTGMPDGDDPMPRDIGWYSPTHDVVLYYGDVGYWPGIARIGRILDGVDTIAAQRGDFVATIELGT